MLTVQARHQAAPAWAMNFPFVKKKGNETESERQKKKTKIIGRERENSLPQSTIAFPCVCANSSKTLVHRSPLHIHEGVRSHSFYAPAHPILIGQIISIVIIFTITVIIGHSVITTIINIIIIDAVVVVAILISHHHEGCIRVTAEVCHLCMTYGLILTRP